MREWTEGYMDFPGVSAFCAALADTYPDWCTLESVGDSRMGEPLWLLTLGCADGHSEDRPGFWLDGGTHAAEWTGVMAALHAARRWLEQIQLDPAQAQWFEQHTVYVMPCISPDGFQAIHDGAPFLRSTLRPPKADTVRVGLDPADMDGDGAVRWMRWKHPAGPFVADSDAPVAMRQRRLDDSPADAFFVCDEGLFLSWDGHRWTAAPREFGADLNRNFPSNWAPFTMFGMDSGTFPASEPEARAVLEAFSARPLIAAALTNHTYTGCLLTQPYRKPSPLPKSDIDLMDRLAHQAVEDTGYRVFKTFPDFAYDVDKPIVGVWADTLSTVFGVPGYTLELWDPYAHCGVQVEKPAEFFARPDPKVLKALLTTFGAAPHAVTPWRPFDHPQLGPVEIGGIDYFRTIRNPPLELLAAECEKGFLVADRLRRTLPQVVPEVRITPHGAAHWIELVMDNVGCLSTSGLAHGETVALTPPVSAQLALEGDACRLVNGVGAVALEHMDGWGVGVQHPAYPSLGARGHRAVARWLVEGEGEFRIRWSGGRGGRGTLAGTLKQS